MSSTPYDRQTSFALFSAENPTSQQSGTDLDAEFNAVKISLDDTQQNLALIQDDDGVLKRGSVGQAQFDSSVSLGFAAPSQWASGILYDADISTVFHASIFYIANTTHTSGASFDASKWDAIADLSAAAAISDGSITSAKLAAGAVAGDKLADGVVANSKLATGSVTSTKLADSSVTFAKLADSTHDPLIDFLFPAGLVLPFAGNAEPTGWLFCDGRAVSRATYPALYATIFGAYGGGDGSTTFNLPDLRGRVPAGVDIMGGVAAGRLTTATMNGTGLASIGGAERVTLTEAQIPAHVHANALTDPGHAHSYTRRGGVIHQDGATAATVATQDVTDTTGTSTTGISLSNASIGGGGAHSNVQPTLALNYLIKAH